MNATGHRFRQSHCIACGRPANSLSANDRCKHAFPVMHGTIIAQGSPLLGRCVPITLRALEQSWKDAYTPHRVRNLPNLAPVWILLAFVMACVLLHAVGWL